MASEIDMDVLGTPDVDAMSAASDQPADGDETGPVRRCLVSREVLPKEALVRFVVGPDGDIVPDVEERLPGRGMWVKADRSVLEAAVAKGLFAKAARRTLEVPPDLVDRVVTLFTRRALNLIGLARRAGQAVCGYERVRAELLKNNVCVLLAASDGAEDGQRKLKVLAEGVPIVALFTNAELAAILGRENVVHAAIAPGRLAESLIAATKRLVGMRRTGE